MKKIVFSLLLMAGTFIATAQTSAAEHNQLPQVRAKKMVSYLSTQAGIAGDQIGKVNDAYIEFYTAKDALMADKSVKAKDKDAKLGELRTKRDAVLKTTLSPSQWNLWEEFLKKQNATGTKSSAIEN